MAKFWITPGPGMTEQDGIKMSVEIIETEEKYRGWCQILLAQVRYPDGRVAYIRTEIIPNSHRLDVLGQPLRHALMVIGILWAVTAFLIWRKAKAALETLAASA